MMGEVAFTDVLDSDEDMDSTAISNIFIDEYMKDANDAQLKIYLYLVRTMSQGRTTSITEMADTFNHTEKEVVRSLVYWENHGLLTLQKDERGNILGIHLNDLEPGQSESQVISISAARQQKAAKRTAAKKSTAKPEKKPVPDTPDKESQELLFVCEQYIGKPLQVSEMQTIYYIRDELHFSPDLIDYLMQYCVGMGKRDFRYIEKVAINWAEEGITTVSQAKNETARGPKKKRTAKTGAANSFNRFEQNQYDFDELEKKLLNQ